MIVSDSNLTGLVINIVSSTGREYRCAASQSSLLPGEWLGVQCNPDVLSTHIKIRSTQKPPLDALLCEILAFGRMFISEILEKQQNCTVTKGIQLTNL